MKIVKIKPGKETINRKLISSFGEKVYHSEGVSRIFIKVYFEDGSSIGFKRDMDEDEYEEILKEELGE